MVVSVRRVAASAVMDWAAAAMARAADTAIRASLFIFSILGFLLVLHAGQRSWLVVVIIWSVVLITFEFIS